MYTRNHLRSHLRAIVALDHRRLIRPGKKFRPNFLRSTSLLYKILPTNLGACKPTFYIIYTSHLRWNSTMRHCFYHTDLGQNAVFHSTRGLLAKQLKIFPKSPYVYMASRFSLLQSELWSCLINRVTLQHNKEFIMVIFYLMALSICNLQKRLIRAAFWVPPASDVHWTTENKQHSD